MVKYDIRLPNGQGWSSDIEETLDSYMSKYYPKWKQFASTITIPVLPVADWQGPSGYASGSIEALSVFPTQKIAAQASKGHLIKKFAAEMAVYKQLLSFCAAKELTCFLFHNPPLSLGHVEILSQYLGVELPTNDPTQVETSETIKPQRNWSAEFTDIVLLTPNLPLVLVEVKSSVNELKNANKQLDCAINWINSVIALAYPHEPIPIVGIIAVPLATSKSKPKDDRTSKYHYIFEENFEPDKFRAWCSVNLPLLATPLNLDVCIKLASMFTLLKIAKFSKASTKVAITQTMIDGVLVQREVVDTITSQNFLHQTYEIQSMPSSKRLKKAESKQNQQQSAFDDQREDLIEKAASAIENMKLDNVDNHSAKHRFSIVNSQEVSQRRNASLSLKHRIEDALFNEVIFLNPDQTAVWNSPYLFQIIGGYAATGKTVLVQNMAVSKLRDGERVAIFIPKCLIPSYTSFIKKNIPNYDFLSEKQHILLGDLEDMARLCSNIDFMDYNMFADELNTLSRNCSGRAIETIIGLWKQFNEQSKEKLFWVAYDTFQSLNFVTDDSDGENDNVLSGKLPAFICKLLYNNGASTKLTTVLRCTEQLLKHWKDEIPQSFLEQGHNVHGPEVYRAGLNRHVDELQDEAITRWWIGSITVEIHKKIVGLLAEGWLPQDIGVVFVTSSVFGLESFLFRDVLNNAMNKGELEKLFDAVSVSGRFSSEAAICVDMVSMTISQEWPVVIVVEDPRCVYISRFQRYLAMSRSIVLSMKYEVCWYEIEQYNYTITFLLENGTWVDIITHVTDIGMSASMLLIELQESSEIFYRRGLFRYTKAKKEMSNEEFINWLDLTGQTEHFLTEYNRSREKTSELLSHCVAVLNDYHKTCVICLKFFAKPQAVVINSPLIINILRTNYLLAMRHWFMACTALKSYLNFDIPVEAIAALDIPAELQAISETCNEQEWTNKWQEIILKSSC